MIKLLEDSNILRSFTDICGEKLKSLAISYGTAKPFCTFWQQIDGAGDITAVICKIGSAVTVSLKNADRQELVDFLEFIGFDELICDETLGDEIVEYDKEKIYAVEKAVNPQNVICSNLSFNEFSAIYNQLAETDSDAIEVGDFDSWYVDLAHRIRHGGAVAILREYGCGIGLLSESTVIVNGIVVNPSSRSRGYGKQILNYIENFGKTRSLAFCLETELNFYKKCGYKLTGNYSLFRKGKKNNA